jgi:hypothetical protein
MEPNGSREMLLPRKKEQWMNDSALSDSLNCCNFVYGDAFHSRRRLQGFHFGGIGWKQLGQSIEHEHWTDGLILRESRSLWMDVPWRFERVGNAGKVRSGNVQLNSSMKYHVESSRTSSWKRRYDRDQYGVFYGPVKMVLLLWLTVTSERQWSYFITHYKP